VVQAEVLKKPDWIRVKAGSPTTRFYEIKDVLRENKLVTVCEEASLPQHRRMLWQRHGHLHDHGRQVHAPLPVLRRGPWPPRPAGRERARNLANTIAKLKLKYVVITSVDRDDLRDGGAGHFVDCIQRRRANCRPAPRSRCWCLTFRGRDDRALEILKAAPPT
jgi:lipoic acid synthetase